MVRSTSPPIGIAAIATYEPAWKLSNQWFGGRIARKFVQHTGTESRPISAEDEIAMGLRAVANLRRETPCDLRECRGIVFVSPSFLPPAVAARYLTHEARQTERVHHAAKSLARQLRVPRGLVVGMNWFCSGYAKALETVQRRVVPTVSLQRDQFILVITATRISRITDFGCTQTAPLFGDLATATLVARTDSSRYPVHFRLLSAHAGKEPAPQPFFDFALRDNVLLPQDDGGEARQSQRVVFSLDGLGIADVAPRAMAGAVNEALQAAGLSPDQLKHVVPHQAGTGILRLAALKLEQLGIGAEVTNGITSQVGNVSSSSIPYALGQKWDVLDGLIACPTAAVGSPGKAEVSKGCILLEAAARRGYLQRSA
jgi:3-oxoacyl-[acyl-carrier-protein] synthase III